MAWIQNTFKFAASSMLCSLVVSGAGDQADLGAQTEDMQKFRCVKGGGWFGGRQEDVFFVRLRGGRHPSRSNSYDVLAVSTVRSLRVISIMKNFTGRPAGRGNEVTRKTLRSSVSSVVKKS